jgi:hypothetical protein
MSGMKRLLRRVWRPCLVAWAVLLALVYALGLSHKARLPLRGKDYARRPVRTLADFTLRQRATGDGGPREVRAWVRLVPPYGEGPSQSLDLGSPEEGPTAVLGHGLVFRDSPAWAKLTTLPSRSPRLLTLSVRYDDASLRTVVEDVVAAGSD